MPPAPPTYALGRWLSAFHRSHIPALQRLEGGRGRRPTGRAAVDRQPPPLQPPPGISRPLLRFPTAWAHSFARPEDKTRVNPCPPCRQCTTAALREELHSHAPRTPWRSSPRMEIVTAVCPDCRPTLRLTIRAAGQLTPCRWKMYGPLAQSICFGLTSAGCPEPQLLRDSTRKAKMTIPFMANRSATDRGSAHGIQGSPE